MSRYRSLPLHNAACNEIYYRFQACEKEHPVGRFFGKCSPIHKELETCLRQQHKNRLEASWKRQERKQQEKAVRTEQ